MRAHRHTLAADHVRVLWRSEFMNRPPDAQSSSCLTFCPARARRCRAYQRLAKRGYRVPLQIDNRSTLTRQGTRLSQQWMRNHRHHHDDQSHTVDGIGCARRHSSFVIPKCISSVLDCSSVARLQAANAAKEHDGVVILLRDLGVAGAVRLIFPFLQSLMSMLLIMSA